MHCWFFGLLLIILRIWCKLIRYWFEEQCVGFSAIYGDELWIAANEISPPNSPSWWPLKMHKI